MEFKIMLPYLVIDYLFVHVVDGAGWCWMTFPIGKVIPNWAPFPTGLMGLGFL